MILDGLFDVDGCAGNFTEYLLRSLNSEVHPEDVLKWDIRNYLSESESKQMTAFLSGPSGWFWEEQPVMEGAQEAMRLIGEVAGIHWVTSPWHSCPVWESTRRRWLGRHFGAKYGDVTFTYQKWRVDGTFILDDKPQHVLEWVKHRFCKDPSVFGLIFDAPYNRDFAWDHGLPIARVHGWDEAVESIQLRAVYRRW